MSLTTDSKEVPRFSKEVFTTRADAKPGR